MPPGNNNAKPSPKGKCTYCRKESCGGSNCTFSGFEGVCGNSSGRQVAYVSEYSSVTSGTIGGSTFGTRQISNGGKLLTTAKVPQAGSTLQQSSGSATATGTSTTVHHVKPYTSTTTTKVPQSGSTLQQSSATYTRTATTTADHVGSHSSTTNTICTESKEQQRTSTDDKTKESNTALQSGPLPLPCSSVSNLGKSVGVYRGHLNQWSLGITNSEQGTSKNNEAAQLISSTNIANPKVSIMPDMKMNKTAPYLPSVPNTQKQLVENKINAMQCSILTSNDCEADLQEVELNNIGKEPEVSKSGDGAAIMYKDVSTSVVVEKTSVKKAKSHQSPKALKYEGVVYQVYGSRNAKVRVAERNGVPLPKSEWGAADAEHKFVILIVDKIMQDDQKSFYPQNTPINSVLSKGDVIFLICTALKKPSKALQLFAQKAWKTDQKINLNNDADSVASQCSQTGSETQESTSSKMKKKRSRRRKPQQKKVVPNEDSSEVSDLVNHWLDTNECSQNRNENSKALKLLAGCHYIGKVIEVRLPYVFIVEVSSNDGKQMVFVFSSKFHPQGISSPAMAPGVSLESSVNIGDEIIVIPIKNTSMQENKFEWVANKAWPKNIQSTISSNLHCSNSSEQLIGPLEILNQQGDTVLKTEQPTYLKNHSPSAKNLKEFDGVILSLQYDWGLVKESVGSQSAYVFTRENAYLFGLCLEHFFLNDVLKEGQMVKFFMESEEIGAMNALAVWCGNRLPDFNLFHITASKYCEERGVKFTTEDLLIQHGKLMYLEK